MICGLLVVVVSVFTSQISASGICNIKVVPCCRGLHIHRSKRSYFWFQGWTNPLGLHQEGHLVLKTQTCGATCWDDPLWITKQLKVAFKRTKAQRQCIDTQKSPSWLFLPSSQLILQWNERTFGLHHCQFTTRHQNGKLIIFTAWSADTS